MGTRGAMGFRFGGLDKIVYNHWDSYPSGLGTTIVNDLIETWRDQDKITKLHRLVDACEVRVGGSDADRVWNHEKFNPATSGIWPYLEYGALPDSRLFLNDSLYCEWAYVINLDDRLFEVYRGFQEKPHTAGRYSAAIPHRPRTHVRSQEIGDYYPIALVKTFDLDEIATWCETWIIDVDPPECAECGGKVTSDDPHYACLDAASAAAEASANRRFPNDAEPGRGN